MSLRFLGLSLVSGSKSGVNLGSLGAFLVLALLFCSGVPQFGVLSGFPAAGMAGDTRTFQVWVSGACSTP